MGGPSSKPQQAIANKQLESADKYAALATSSLGKMDALTAPAISYGTGVVNAAEKGDYSGLVQASGPAMGAISQQYGAAREGIIEGTPAGGGRDEALALLPAQKANAVSSTLNQTFKDALGSLTQIGAAYGGVGLQEGGANLSALSSAENTQTNIAQQQAQKKASTMGFLGQLASAGATGFAGR